MHKILTIATALALAGFIAMGSPSISIAGGFARIDCTDPKHPGGYQSSVDGQCHDAGDKTKFPPMDPEDSSMVVTPPADDEPVFHSYEEFEAKCQSDGGVIMDASRWNAFVAKHPSEGHSIPDGSFQCYIAAKFS
jgi:hypothetical protein